MTRLLPRLGRGRRVPVRLQSTAVECGVACLAMVLSHHGRDTTIRELRDRMVLGRDGATAGAIARNARELGLEVRAFRAEPSALGQLGLPLVAHWGMNHFVVIERVDARGADIIDPAVGRMRVTLDEVDRQFTGVVMEFAPTPDLELRRGGGLDLLGFVKPFIPRDPRVVASIIGASVLLTVLGLVPALVIGFVVDRVIDGGQRAVLTVLGIGLAAYAVGFAVLTLARSEFLLWLQTRIDWSMMRSFVEHLVSLPYRFFQLRRGGDLLVRVSSTAYVRDVVSSQMLAVVLDTGLLVVYLTVIGVQSLVYVVVIVAVALLQIFIMVLAARRAQRLTERELQTMGEAQSTLLETVNGAETIKAAGAEDVAVQRWSDRYVEQLEASVQRRRLDNAMEATLTVLRIGTPMLMIWLGANLVLSGQLSLGEMLALNALTGAALAPVGTLGSNLKSLQTVRVHLDRLRDIFDEVREDHDQGDTSIALQGHITLDEVSFRYAPEAPSVIDDISLDIPTGSTLAIVGRSGSGKSTLARLIMGLYPPSSGMVSFDSTPLQELDLVSLRRQCGVVTQDPDVFSGSILQNISLVDDDADLEDVVRAASIAAIHEDVVAMPMGYETILSDGGGGLSGGQLQRLALARALVAYPRVVLLDEATSHLDSATEATVHHNLAALDCTRIVIAHRLSTVRNADRIVMLKDGRVIETGTHERLLELDGEYARLVAGQLTM